MGRQTEYNQPTADKVCALLTEGISLRTICKRDDLPCAATIFKWLREQPAFSDQYAKAKEASADALLEDMLYIADDSSEDVQRSRLRVDTRKWAASKLKPKKYGDKITQENTGPDGGPIKTESRIIIDFGDGDAEE